MVRKLSITLLSVAVLLAGCTSAHVIRPEPGSIHAQIEKGDRVNIVTHEGDQMTFWVTEVEKDALSGVTGVNRDGKRYRVPFADIRILELERTDALKTGLFVGAGLLTFWFAAAAAVPTFVVL